VLRPFFSQTGTGGSKFYVHAGTQQDCKTSKCTARGVVCRKCEKAGFVHFHHVHAACPFDADFCKKIVADASFKNELARVSAKKRKEAEEKLVKERNQQEKIDADNLIRDQAQARKDAENLEMKRAELQKLEKAAKASASKASVASGPPESNSSGFSSRLPRGAKTPPSCQRGPGERLPLHWEFVPASGLAKAQLYKHGMPADLEGWVEWQSMQ